MNVPYGGHVLNAQDEWELLRNGIWRAAARRQ
jgi:hypothetical protein